jgi:outer membrane protein assembly factor BamB
MLMPSRFLRAPLLVIVVLTLAIAACGTTSRPAATPQVTATLRSGSSGAAHDWMMYHYDRARTGYVADTPDPKTLTTAWSIPLDAAVYAQPLAVAGKVIVATEGNIIYALNARTGSVLWKTNLGAPVTRDNLPCGNISPLGITGTPVYDPATKLIFAVAETSGPKHELVALDLASGQVRQRRSADPPGMKSPAAHQQRAALALEGGIVYIAYGGLFGDCGDYHGMVVGARTDGQGSLIVYQVPTTREAGIWAPPGPVIDANGKLYVAVGNGAATSGAWDKSDSVLRLSPQLQLEDGFAPTQWPQDNAADQDLGSMAPVLLSDGSIIAAGKSGQGYLLHSDHLGGVGGQLQEANLCSAYGGAAALGTRAFLPCTDGVREVKVEAGTMTVGWRAPDGADGSPVIGGHTLYTMQSRSALVALDVDSGQQRASVEIGETTRFASPTIYGNALFVGTLAGITAIQIGT